MSYNMRFNKCNRSIGLDSYITDSMTNKDVTEILNKNNDDLDSVTIFTMGSISKFCMNFIYEQIEDKSICYSDGYPHIIIRSFSDYTKLCNAVVKLMDRYSCTFGKVEYAINNKKEDGSFCCVPVEGISVQCEDKSIKFIFNDEDELILVPNTDYEQYYVIQQFIKAVLSASNIDWVSEFLVLEGEW